MKKFKGWLIKQKIDKEGDLFNKEACKKIEKQIEEGDPIFSNFITTKPPIGIIKSVRYVDGKGIEIEGELISDIPIEDYDIRIGGYCKDFEVIDGIRIIKDIEFIECSLVPKFADVYEEEE